MAIRGKLVALVLAACVAGLLAGTAAAQENDDRHAGYYYPEPQATETYTARVTTLSDSDRSRRIGFVTGLTKQTLAGQYEPSFVVFAKGDDAEKLLIVGLVEGRLDTSNDGTLVFTAIDKKQQGRGFSIPYGRISDLEYGQKAGRRVGAAAATTVLLGPIGLLSLFSKKRKHYLTVGFTDDAGSDQVVVLELGKDIVRTTLAVVETRSGKEIQYQDEEARKSAK